MADIAFERVSKYFQGAAALSDVSFRCASGEIVVIFGPPGAGKSTLLRSLSGLEDIDSGEIRLAGRVVSSLPIHRRKVAMAFESYALYPHLKVRTNLEFPLKAPGVRMAPAERQRRLGRVAELLKIDSLLDRYPDQLSGGQRQRVSLGRALIRDADATLLDEPIAHLDARLRSMLRGELRIYLKDVGATTLYATPDFQEGFGIASRVLVIIKGIVHQVGTPEEIYAAPANSQVAALIGDPAMNLIPVAPDGTLDIGEQRLPLPMSIPGSVQVGLRPSDVALVSPEARVKGRVVLIERIGSSLVVNLDVGNRVLAAKVAAPTLPLKVGEVVGLEFCWSQAHFFGEDSARMESGVLNLSVGGPA
jgi:ABC-type sugar transport system ATPase subunit